MRILAATLFALGAALVVSPITVLSRKLTKDRARPITGKRRDSMLRSTGIVNGTESGLQRMVRQRVGFVLVASVIAVVLVLSNQSLISFAVTPVLLFGAWSFPSSLARTRERARRKAIELEIVDSLGEMVMGVEVGLTLESVMRLYASRHSTPLANEFRNYLDRVSLGATRDTALAELEARTPTNGLQLFVAAIRQNHRIGAPLGTVLRQQASTARRRRRQAIEEQSAKISMKMVFPTVFCILPALLVVVVGPAIIRTLQTLPG